MPILAPKSRLVEITGYVSALFKIPGPGPWLVTRGAVEMPCAVVTWEDLLEELSEELSTVSSERFRDDLSQFRAMYRVLVGDDMPPITDDKQVLAWRDQEALWWTLVERVTRALTAPGGGVLPFGLERGAQPYRRRYVCRRVSREEPWACYSVGTRDPFQGHKTPVWLRFHKGNGHFIEIAGRLERSDLWAEAVSSQGHLWFPLDVPLNSDRETMTGALIAQVQRILAVAYPPELR